MEFCDEGEDHLELQSEVLSGDSEVSKHTQGRLLRKNHLEILVQKANSIGGIRKMNLQFKEERRAVRALDRNKIRAEYWEICAQFLLSLIHI